MTLKRVIIGLLCIGLPTRFVGQDSGGSAKSQWVTFSLNSDLVPGPVDVGVLLPPGHDRDRTPLPLLLFLHGGGGSSKVLYGLRATFERMWNAGSLPAMVVAAPSARRSFYMDYRDGSQRWETFVLSEALSQVRERFNVQRDRQGTLIAGGSMGGMGTLRMAFKYPDRFRAAVAWAPGVEPALAFAEIDPSDRAHRSKELYEQIFGRPVDEKYWQANHPLYLLKTRMQNIAASGIEIYIAAGGEDQYHLYRGAEVMHRMLFDAGVKHEFHLVRGAGHGTGQGMPIEEALGFFDRVLRRAKQP